LLSKGKRKKYLLTIRARFKPTTNQEKKEEHRRILETGASALKINCKCQILFECNNSVFSTNRHPNEQITYTSTSGPDKDAGPTAINTP
jgi:hypothetical protein